MHWVSTSREPIRTSLLSLRNWYCLALGGSSKACLEDHFGGQVNIFGRRKGVVFQYFRVLLRQLCEPKFCWKDWASIFSITPWALTAGRALPTSPLSVTLLLRGDIPMVPFLAPQICLCLPWFAFTPWLWRGYSSYQCSARWLINTQAVNEPVWVQILAMPCEDFSVNGYPENRTFKIMGITSSFQCILIRWRLEKKMPNWFGSLGGNQWF